MGGADPAGSRGVDQDQATLQQRARDVDLDPQDLGTAGLGGPGQIAGDVVHGQGDDPAGARGAAVLVGVGDDQPGGGLLTVSDDGDGGGGLGVADPAHRDVEQCIDQVALALFELTHHHDPGAGVGDPIAGGGHAGGEVLATGGARHVGETVDDLDDFRGVGVHVGPGVRSG